MFQQVVISGARKQSVDPAYRQGSRTGSLVDYPITKQHYSTLSEFIFYLWSIEFQVSTLGFIVFIQIPIVDMATQSTSYGMANNMGQDDLSHIVKVVMNRNDQRTISILQALAIAGIRDVPSLLLLDQQEIKNLYLVNTDGIEEKLATGVTFVLASFCVFVSKLAENGTKMPVWQDLTRLMFERFRIEQSGKLACNTSSTRIAPRSEPTANVSRSTTTTTDKTVINTIAHNICAEVTGGEIESPKCNSGSPKCNSGETSNTHTTTGSPKFDYGETNKQTSHGSTRKAEPVIDYCINHNLSLTTVNTCGVKYSSNNSTVYSHVAMISNDDDTFIEAIDPAKVNVATTKLANDNPVQRTKILEIGRDSTDEDVIGSAGVELATNKIADDDPLQSTLKLENNDPVCVIVVSDTVKVNVATNALADNDPVKDNVVTNKLANNDPVHQTNTLNKTQFDAMNGKVIFQILWSANGEPLGTAVTNIAANSVSLQRTYVSPSTVDLTDDDPTLIIDSYSNGTKRNSCFQERGVVPLVPPGCNNNDRMSLAMALIDTLADDDPYNNSHIVTPSMLLQGNTSDMMSEEMGSVGTKNGAG